MKINLTTPLQCPRWFQKAARKVSGALLIPLLCVGVSHAAPVNLLTNPGFENGQTGWSNPNLVRGGASVVINDPTLAHSGSYCISNYNATGWSSAEQGDAQGGWGTGVSLPVSDQKFYQLAGWVKVPGASPATPQQITLRYRFEPSANRVDVGAMTITNESWTQLRSPWVVPAAGDYFASYWEVHSVNNGVMFYADDCELLENAPYVLNGRVVDSSGAGVDGATVTASSTNFVAPSAITAGGGYYTFNVLPENATYTVSTVTPGFKASTMVAVSGTPTSVPNLVLGPDPDYDPTLLFSVRSSNFVVGANWLASYPAGTPLTRHGNPATHTINGQQWVYNHSFAGDGFTFANIPQGSALAMNGGTIVTAIRPILDGAGAPYQCAVSVLLAQFEICVASADGLVRVGVKGTGVDPNYDTGIRLPNGQNTVLSLVVQPTGESVLYTNGVQAWSTTNTADFTSLTANTSWSTDINVGMGWNADSWSSFNGDIGDTYVYQVAVDNAKRSALEASLIAKYGRSANYTITATAGAGGTITPSGAVAVPQNVSQTFTITPNTYDDLTGLVVDGVPVDVSAMPNSATYTFNNVTADHTIAASFTEWPLTVITGKVVQVDSTPMAGVLVTATGGRAVYTATTSADGTYSIRVKPGVTNTVTPRLAGYTFAPASRTASGPDDLTGKDFTISYAGPQKLVDLKFNPAWTDGMSVTNWTNNGTLGGVFVADGGKNTAAATVSANYLGSNAVVFANSKLLLSTNGTTADAALVRTPLSLSDNGSYTVFAQIASIADLPGEQYYLAFAHNGGDGNCAAFDFGTAPAWGAVAHWGSRDMGWSNPETTGGPYSGVWHFVAITFDGSVERVYLDGAEVNSEAKTLPLYANNPFAIGSRFEDNNGNGLSAPFNGALAALQVYDMALTPKQIASMSGGAPSYYWAGPNNGNWSSPLNWNNTVPGYGNIAVFSDSATAGRTVQIDSFVMVKGIQFNGLVASNTIASSLGNTLTLDNGSGLATVSSIGTNFINVGLMAAVGATFSGPGTVTLNGDNSIGSGANVGMYVNAGGTLNLASGTTTMTTGSGITVDYNGKLTITGTVLSSGHDQIIGDAGTKGTLELRGTGSWTHTAGGVFQIGNDAPGCTGIVNIYDSAVFQSTSLNVGVGWGGGCTGIVNQNGGRVSVGSDAANGGLRLGWNVDSSRTSTGLYNLNSGVLETTRVRGDNLGTNVFYFNGGTLRAVTNRYITNFVYNLTHAYVQDNGALLDDGGLAVTLNQSLEHGTGAAIDGGLTKQGSGTLTLNRASTYTGPTKVQAGVLACSTNSALAGGTLDISTGAKVALNYTGTRSVAALSFGGVAQPNGTYGATGSGAANIDDVHFAGTGTVTVGPLVIPVPVLLPSGFTHPGGVPTFTFDTVAGYKYRVVYKNALSDTTWRELAPGFVVSTGGSMTVNDTAGAGQPQRFYRIEAANP